MRGYAPVNFTLGNRHCLRMAASNATLGFAAPVPTRARSLFYVLSISIGVASGSISVIGRPKAILG